MPETFSPDLKQTTAARIGFVNQCSIFLPESGGCNDASDESNRKAGFHDTPLFWRNRVALADYSPHWLHENFRSEPEQSVPARKGVPFFH
jgi:hypothetical protein